jgi:hypothetical protein
LLPNCIFCSDITLDLYGNDDDGFTSHPGGGKSPKQDSSVEPVVKSDNEDASFLKRDSPQPLSTLGSVSSTTGNNSLPSSNSFASSVPPAQAIQTYQQYDDAPAPAPRTPFNADSPTASLAGDMSQIPVGERPVRPSEMKDEG